MTVTFKLLRKYINSDELQNYVIIIDTEHKKGEIVSKDYFLINDMFMSGDLFTYQLSEATLITDKRVNVTQSNREMITFEDGVSGVFIGNDDEYEYLEGELFNLYHDVFINDSYAPVGGLKPEDYDDIEDYACDWWDYVSNHYNFELLENDIIRIDIPDTMEGYENVTKVIFN